MTKETKWSIDQAHSEIAFRVKHLMISNLKGSFKKFDASIYTINKDFTTAEIDLWIDTASIDTRDIKRDEHLRAAEFFDVKNHKQITFQGRGISKSDQDGNHELWGDLTIKGISKRIKLNVEFGGTVKDPYGNEKSGFKVTGKINRNDWGLAWNTSMENGGLMVSEEVTISCEIELTNEGQKDLTMELESGVDKKIPV